MKGEKQKISAILLFEIIGRPPQHLTSSLNEMISRMDTEKGIKVANKKIAEPKKMEQKAGIASSTEEGIRIEQNEFYSSFAEVELEAESMFDLVVLAFNYMPAHVEITSPENISLTNGNWSDFLSQLMQKLHAYDELARVIQVEKVVLENKLRSLLEEKKEKHSEKKAKPKNKKAMQKEKRKF